MGRERVCAQRKKLRVARRRGLDLNRIVDPGGVRRVEDNDPQASVEM